MTGDTDSNQSALDASAGLIGLQDLSIAQTFGNQPKAHVGALNALKAIGMIFGVVAPLIPAKEVSSIIGSSNAVLGGITSWIQKNDADEAAK